MTTNIDFIVMSTIAKSLKALSEELIQLIATEFDSEKCTRVLSQIYSFAPTITNNANKDLLNMKDLQKVCSAIEQTHKLSVIPVTIYESDGKVQTPKTYTLGSLLLNMLTQDFHSAEAKCHQYNKDTKMCGLKNEIHSHTIDADGICTGTHLYKCTFHTFDTLAIHSVLTGIINASYVFDVLNGSRDDGFHAFVFGIYHDIGKMLTLETYEFAPTTTSLGTVTGFPAHAEVGSMQFSALWSDEMNSIISHSSYTHIATAILRHMCGYHGDDTESNSYRRALLRVDSDAVRKLLCFNRVGDTLGKLNPPVSQSDFGDSKESHFMSQQHKFENQLSLHSPLKDSFKISFLDEMATATGDRIKSNKIALFMIGTSSAGKTWFVEELTKSLYHIGFSTNAVAHISRDTCIAQVTVGLPLRLEGQAYVKMHSIYAAGKNLTKASKNVAKSSASKADVSSFASAKKNFITSQKEWNDFVDSKVSTIEGIKKIDVWEETQILNIPEMVSTLYNNQITKAISDPKCLLIVMDTFMNCFPHEIEEKCPKELKGLFRLHVHISSYVERKVTTVASSIDEQLKISGTYGLHNPIHPGGFKMKGNKKVFTSLSAEITTDKTLPTSTAKSKFRPHLVCVCVRTPNGTVGYDYTISLIQNLMSEFLTRVQVPAVTQTETKITTSLSNTDDEVAGVDAKTKNMNLQEYYRHLLEEYKGDRAKIRDHLRILPGCTDYQNGFMHNSVFSTTLSKDYDLSTSQEALESNKRTMCQKLATLSIAWVTTGTTKIVRTFDDFMSDAKLYEAYVNSLVIIKYFESYGARFWQNTWAKEMRGSVLFVNPETLEVKVLSFKLPRGAEVITGMIKKSGIDTQDLRQGKVSILDVEQQDTCERICSGKPIIMDLTSKGDGSLLVINMYSGDDLNIVVPIIENFGCAFTKLWLKQSLELTDGTRVFLPTTQGMFMIGDYMSPYMTTSMLVGSTITNRVELSKYKSHTEAWEVHGKKFIHKLMCLKTFPTLTTSQTFCFEAICKNRCGMFGDHPHVELACRYDVDRLLFLGTSLNDKLLYVPHTIYTKGWEKLNPFEEPLWWHTTHADQINAMVYSLGKIIMGEITKDDFLKMFPPMNYNYDIKNAIIDPEGFVAMKHLEVSKVNGIISSVYSKIKTEPYYRSHKLRIDNLPYLVKLADSAGHLFPAAAKVASICKDGAMAERFKIVGTKILELLNFSPEGDLMKNLIQKFNDSQSVVASKKMAKSPYQDFEKRPHNVQCKIVLNRPEFDCKQFLLPIYLDVFPEIDTNIPDLDKMARGLTMLFEPWQKGYEERVRVLDVSSESIRNLVVACIGTTLI